jgi:hypothetical protein
VTSRASTWRGGIAVNALRSVFDDSIASDSLKAPCNSRYFPGPGFQLFEPLNGIENYTDRSA